MSAIRVNRKKFLVNIEPSPHDPRDYIFCSTPLQSKTDKLPTVLDYRESLQPIRNQGAAGSCLAQSGACMKEWQEYKDVGLKEYMSPQFIYDKRSNAPHSGMYGRDLMKILLKSGCPTEKDWKYRYSDSPKEIPKEILKKAEKFKIESFASVPTRYDLKESLYLYGPCILCVPVFNHGTKMWKPSKPSQRRLGGHAMTIVGYDDNNEHFIIRNSWGSFWGDKGYCYFPYEDWGAQWEVWTTMDAPTPKNEDKDEDSEDSEEASINRHLKRWWPLYATLGAGATALGTLSYIF